MQEQLEQLKQEIESLKAKLEFFSIPQELRNTIQNTVIIKTDDITTTTTLQTINTPPAQTAIARVPTGFILMEWNGRLYRIAHYGNV